MIDEHPMYEGIKGLWQTGVYTRKELVALSKESVETVNTIIGHVRVQFDYGNGPGYFHVWPRKDKWQWDCYGNSGEEATQESAISAARAWVRESRSISRM